MLTTSSSVLLEIPLKVIADFYKTFKNAYKYTWIFVLYFYVVMTWGERGSKLPSDSMKTYQYPFH